MACSPDRTISTSTGSESLSTRALPWNGIRLDRDGNVLRIYWTLTDNERHCVVADAEGNPLPRYQGVDIDDPGNAGQFVQFSNVVFDDLLVPWPYSMQTRGYRSRVPEAVRLKAVATPKVEGDVHIASSGGGDMAWNYLQPSTGWQGKRRRPRRTRPWRRSTPGTIASACFESSTSELRGSCSAARAGWLIPRHTPGAADYSFGLSRKVNSRHRQQAHR